MAHIWQISVLRFEIKSIVSGVVLHGKPVAKSKAGKHKFKKVLGSYFKKPVANEEIVLTFGSVTLATVTDNKGSFTFELDQPLPESFSIFSENQPEPLETLQTYPIFFDNSEFPLDIISDVDDTILVSYTASHWKRVKTILFTSPQKRESISFSKAILDAINSHGGRIFYVSKSESNLFSLLSSFIRHQNMPEGNLFLTPYLRFNQLLNPKKGKDYKERTIGRIIDSSTGKRFILMGDDTQQDMAVYARIAEKYPDRIFKIFIHKTRKNLHGNKKKQFDKLHTLAVPFLYFSDADLVTNELEMINEITN